MTFLNILCYLGSCIVSIFQKSKDDQSQIQPTSFGGEALEDVSVDHDGLLIPETPAGPAPLDMILVEGANCAKQQGTAQATIEEGEAMKGICGDRPRSNGFRHTEYDRTFTIETQLFAVLRRRRMQ